MTSPQIFPDTLRLEASTCILLSTCTMNCTLCHYSSTVGLHHILCRYPYLANTFLGFFHFHKPNCLYHLWKYWCIFYYLLVTICMSWVMRVYLCSVQHVLTLSYEIRRHVNLITYDTFIEYFIVSSSLWADMWKRIVVGLITEIAFITHLRTGAFIRQWRIIWAAPSYPDKWEQCASYSSV